MNFSGGKQIPMSGADLTLNAPEPVPVYQSGHVLRDPYEDPMLHQDESPVDSIGSSAMAGILCSALGVPHLAGELVNMAREMGSKEGKRFGFRVAESISRSVGDRYARPEEVMSVSASTKIGRIIDRTLKNEESHGNDSGRPRPKSGKS